MHSIPCCFGTTLSSINTWLLSYGGLFCKPYNSIFWIAAICKNDRLQLLEFFMKAFRMIPFDLDALNLIINYSEEQVYNTKSGMHGIFIFMSGKRKICIERNSILLYGLVFSFLFLRQLTQNMRSECNMNPTFIVFLQFFCIERLTNSAWGNQKIIVSVKSKCHFLGLIDKNCIFLKLYITVWMK